MTTKYKIIVSIVVVLTSFAFGRYSAPKVPDSHTVTDTKVDDKKDTDQVEHKKTVIVQEPSGVITTTITDLEQTDTKEDTQTQAHVDATVTAPKTSTLNLSALAATHFTGANAFKPLYGVSVSKQIIGPVRTGIWALTDGTIGVSIGLDF